MADKNVTVAAPRAAGGFLRIAERPGRGWAAALGVTTLLLVLAVMPPFVDARGRLVLMHLFSALCHQIADRSPHVDGIALAVCHRCIGIYAGLVAAAILFPWARRWDALLDAKARLILPASLVPPGVDWLGGVIGLWVNTPASRIVTGACFGLVAGYYLTRALEQAARRGRRRPAAVR